MVPPKTSSDTADRIVLDEAETALIESMGMIVQGEGLPRIAGRIIGLFTVTDGALSFDDLSKILQVSRASVSTNTRMLEEFGIIERVGIAGHRQDHFRMADRPYARLVERQTERHRRARDTLERAVSALPADSSSARRRADQILAYYDTQIGGGEAALDALSETRRVR